MNQSFEVTSVKMYQLSLLPSQPRRNGSDKFTYGNQKHKRHYYRSYRDGWRGVLHECLEDPKIASITLLTRRSIGIVHPKVTEVLLTDLFAFTGNEPGLNNADACFYGYRAVMDEIAVYEVNDGKIVFEQHFFKS